MYHSVHTEFIETPLIKILEEGIQACRPLGDGIQTEPMKEYFLSSLFLRMTGAQEQKLKCILWELATHDYKVRYKWAFRGDTKFSFGEMSDRKDKQLLYKILRESVEKMKGGAFRHKRLGDNGAKAIRDDVVALLKKAPIFEVWLKKELDFVCDDDCFLPHSSEPNDNNYGDHTVLLGGRLGLDYEGVVYGHRNRCAHNLTSYQRYLHSLDRLRENDYPRQNYIYRFIILILIDEIFMELYKEYKRLVEIDLWL